MVREGDGRAEVILLEMRAHLGFVQLMQAVVTSIERDAPSSVAFMCAWGKHRSMAWAEMLKAEHYPMARVRHVRLEHSKEKQHGWRRAKSRLDGRAAKGLCWEDP
mmetsp:Transcript_46053/g.76117  ORF Transcript_46053/g.76117 Transcript_46053/m.76117 type:complete len:105 (-) Transcript_46053:79-393(-)